MKGGTQFPVEGHYTSISSNADKLFMVQGTAIVVLDLADVRFFVQNPGSAGTPVIATHEAFASSFKIVDDGTDLYVAGGDFGLLKVDTVTGDVTVLDGDSGGRWCWDLELDDSGFLVSLWGAHGATQVRTYNTNIPTYPMLKCELNSANDDPLSDSPEYPATGYALEIHGDYAYVAMGVNGLMQVHYKTGSILASPPTAKQGPVPGGMQGIAPLFGPPPYTINPGNAPGWEVELYNPASYTANPQQFFDDAQLYRFRDLAIQEFPATGTEPAGVYLYVAADNCGVAWYDITDPLAWTAGDLSPANYSPEPPIGRFFGYLWRQPNPDQDTGERETEMRYYTRVDTVWDVEYGRILVSAMSGRAPSRLRDWGPYWRFTGFDWDLHQPLFESALPTQPANKAPFWGQDSGPRLDLWSQVPGSNPRKARDFDFDVADPIPGYAEEHPDRSLEMAYYLDTQSPLREVWCFTNQMRVLRSDLTGGTVADIEDLTETSRVQFAAPGFFTAYPSISLTDNTLVLNGADGPHADGSWWKLDTSVPALNRITGTDQAKFRFEVNRVVPFVLPVGTPGTPGVVGRDEWVVGRYEAGNLMWKVASFDTDTGAPTNYVYWDVPRRPDPSLANIRMGRSYAPTAVDNPIDPQYMFLGNTQRSCCVQVHSMADLLFDAPVPDPTTGEGGTIPTDPVGFLWVHRPLDDLPPDYETEGKAMNLFDIDIFGLETSSVPKKVAVVAAGSNVHLNEADYSRARVVFFDISGMYDATPNYDALYRPSVPPSVPEVAIHLGPGESMAIVTEIVDILDRQVAFVADSRGHVYAFELSGDLFTQPFAPTIFSTALDVSPIDGLADVCVDIKVLQEGPDYFAYVTASRQGLVRIPINPYLEINQSDPPLGILFGEKLVLNTPFQAAGIAMRVVGGTVGMILGDHAPSAPLLLGDFQ